MTSLTYFTVTADWVPASSVGSLSGIVTFQMLVTSGDGLVAPTLTTPGIVVPITTQGRITNGVLYGLDGNPGVSLLANTSVLNLSSTLYYTVSFADVVYTYSTSSAATQTINLSAFTFAALTSAATVDLSSVAPAAGALAAQILSVTSAEIADATTLGRELLTATSAGAAAALLGVPSVPSAGLIKSTGSALVDAVPGTDYVQPSAIVNNADGTLSVNGVNALEPLSTVTIVTTSVTPAIGQSTWYNATSGNLAPTLLPLSGQRIGARFAVRRDPADVSVNTVTLSCAGSDTFYSSGATTATLPMSGEQREYQVISVSGTKYWVPAGSLNPVAALDNRYLAGASKLVAIGDNGFGTAISTVSTSTVGTGEMMFTVGVAATGIAPVWTHWYTGGSPEVDTDPSGPISFNASLKVVSSTNPGTVTGTIYRLTFGGRSTATLDPGGRIGADLLGVSVAAGDVVAVRTYLASGTAYPPRSTFNQSPSWGGFTATTDLTAPGSAAIAASQGNYYGPSAVLGQAQAANSAKSVLVLGDSIAYGVGDAAYYTIPAFGVGSFVERAFSGVAGLINTAQAGDLAAWFQATGGSFHRLSHAPRCNSAIIEYGSNDFTSGTAAAALEAILLNLATNIRRMGIAKVCLTTIVPRTTSTDYWATTTNQTPVVGESQRVAHNTWVRAGCPVSPTTLAPVSVGTAGAMTAGQFGHPITGIFDTAATVESSLNSGFWKPCQRVATGSMTASGNTLTSSTAIFQSANQESGGDKGTQCFLFGAGASGAALSFQLVTITNSTSVAVNAIASATVSSTQLNIGSQTFDGTHPSPHGHYLMSQAINTSLL